MSARRRPSVNPHPVADRYRVNPFISRIVEFSDPRSEAGGLIRFTSSTDRRGRPYLQITIYRQNRTRVYVEKGGTR
jgi:hypothetical protein